MAQEARARLTRQSEVLSEAARVGQAYSEERVPTEQLFSGAVTGLKNAME